jgi:uncharacterized protein (DUF2237 family)
MGPLYQDSSDAAEANNLFGEPLIATGPEDAGRHLVCAVMTAEFLAFSKAVGNDLSTPRPQWAFPGLKSGDRWCLCALRWKEAFDAGKAPKVVLEATNEKVLRYVRMEDLVAHAWKAAETE